jgi:uncharacterized membrane protein
VTDLRAAPYRLKTLGLALLVILLNATGNLSLARGMRSIPDTMAGNPLAYISAMLHPQVTLGIILLILWLLTRMALFSWADLSFVVPVTAIGYILTAIFGHFFLSETVSLTNWLGTVLIFFGTVLVGTTKPRSVEVQAEVR